MSFISFEYIMLLIVSVLLFYVMPKKIRWIVLLCTNILFYAQAGLGALLVIGGGVLLTYIAGIILNVITKYRRLLVGVYVLAQLVILFGFKYRIFVDITAPLAISFFTLTAIGYVVDVYRGKYKAQNNLLKLVSVMCFFPIMVQGPICRFDELQKDVIAKEKGFDYKGVTYGFTRVVYGMFKKLVIAERLGLVFEYLCSSDDVAMMALNILVYAFYLYTDFSGGIDIAVGAGYMFGVKLPENFNRPFFAISISDYWRRWHMSLGNWLKDYVFYPVSFCGPVVKLSKWIRGKWGNKVAKKVPIYVASLVVWFVTGVWHGVRANFIIWGMLNAVIILASYELEPLYAKFNSRFEFTKGKAYMVFRVVRTFVLMGLLRSLDYVNMTGTTILDAGVADYVVVLFGIVTVLLVELIGMKTDYETAIFKRGTIVSYGIIAVMIAVIIIFGMYGIGYEGKDFIYIRY